MALLFCDGFDHHTNAYGKWGFGYNPSFSSSYSRFGTGQGVRVDTARWLATENFAAQSSLAIGAAVNMQGNDVNQSDYPLEVNGTAGYARVTGASAFDYRFRISSTWISLGPSMAYQHGTWYYLELKVTCHPSNGIVELRVNGETILYQAGLSINGTLSRGSLFGGANNSSACYFDDAYIATDFLGDIRVETLHPTSDASVAWTPYGTGANWSSVDEAVSNADTDYTYSSTVSQQDRFEYGDLATTSGTVHGLQPVVYAKKADAGVRAIRQIVRPSSTISYTDSGNKYLGTDYQMRLGLSTNNPETSSPWSISEVNSAQFGYELTV